MCDISWDETNCRNDHNMSLIDIIIIKITDQLRQFVSNDSLMSATPREYVCISWDDIIETNLNNKNNSFHK